MATNSNYDSAKKTTKLVRGIHSWIKFQKHQGVESLTIQGKEALADLSQDKNGDTNLILNADKDKVNTVASSVPYLAVAHTITGTDPNQEKTATISQDLTQFNLGSDGLIDVSKTETSITLYTTKITEKINEVVTSAVTTKETEIKEYVNTTLSTKETELKEFVTEHTARAVGVSPSYVADEIRKVKEELTSEINKQGGSNLENRNLIIYNRKGSYDESCAKFTISSASTMYTTIVDVIYKGVNDNPNDSDYSNATFYVASGSISQLEQNGVKLIQGNASDKIDWDIILPEKGTYTSIELTIFGDPKYVNDTEYPYNLNIIGDTSYTPPIETAGNTPQPIS